MLRFLCRTMIPAIFSCAAAYSQPQSAAVVSAIPVPDGYARKTCPAGSFGNWVQSLPLKNTDQILLYDGTIQGHTLKGFFTGFDVFAVINMPLLFKSDLEQCADYCMRFWAEYHKASGRLDKLYLFDYNGNKKKFSANGKSFNGFLKYAFSFANSHSIKKGCDTVSEADLMPGDMVVQNEDGGIGHVSMIMDECVAKGGKRLYLIGFSFMPAQEFHIERASGGHGTGGWFTLEGYYRFLEEMINVGRPCLRRFRPL